MTQQRPWGRQAGSSVVRILPQCAKGNIQEEDILYFKTLCMHTCKYVCVYVCMIFETSFHCITLIGVDLKLSILLLLSPKC